MIGRHVRNDRQRSAFTLVEVLAALMLATFGLASIVGIVLYALRISADYQDQAAALATAETVLYDPAPQGLTADAGDADGDGWSLGASSSAIGAPLTGDYSFQVEGWVNGYYVYRNEDMPAEDIVEGSADLGNVGTRWVTISVYVYAGDDDRLLTSLKRRLLRPTEAP